MDFDQFLGKVTSTMLLTGGMLLVMLSPLIFIRMLVVVHGWFGRKRRVR